jgi:hypothetical protein
MSKSIPATMDQALAKIRKYLDENKPAEAIEFISRFGAANAALKNLYGVCLMRTGQLDKALEVYRGICIGHGVSLKSDAPIAHMVNYATVLLQHRNVAGCQDVLRHIEQSNHPGTARIQAALDRWRASLSSWERLKLRLSDYRPEKPIELESPLGVVS